MTEYKPTCFIAMPITTHDDEAARYGGDKHHWAHVMNSLFIPAIKAAGYEPVVPVTTGAFLIHGQIIKNLSETDLVLCDLSSHNPNVFFELGVRTSINRPIALVRDEHTTIPFDTSGINTQAYKSALNGWDMKDEVESLSQHIVDSAESCNGKNPLWSQFGLTITAQEPSSSSSPLEARLDLLMERLDRAAVGGQSVQEIAPSFPFAKKKAFRENVQKLLERGNNKPGFKPDIHFDGSQVLISNPDESISEHTMGELTLLGELEGLIVDFPPF